MIVGIVLGSSVVIALATWWKLRNVFKEARLRETPVAVANEDELPTVSLCIPARNEMHAMTDCLESALRSSYPKLEIIVLDDASRDDTLHLVKSFAHSGVRFIEGSSLPDGWLGKNHALEGLAREASGSLLLFADVDTRFSTHSISRMVACMKDSSADMISVLPTRYNPLRASAILATLRHFWNLLGHSPKHPAVASSAWMIKRSILIDTFKGFGDVADDVRPDKSIAAKVAQVGAYKFVLSSDKLGVSYEKKLSSQRETAIRIYYPDFGLGGVLLRCLGLIICLVPYVVVPVALIAGNLFLSLAALGAISILSVVNGWYLAVLRSTNYALASLCLPFILVREVWLLVASVGMYISGKVTWKGRPVSVTRRDTA